MSRFDLRRKAAAVMSATAQQLPDGNYLYYYGNECTALTGGWTNDYYYNTSYTKINITKEPAYLRAYHAVSTLLYYISFGAQNAIELTNFTKLIVTVDVGTSPYIFTITHGASRTGDGSTWTSLLSVSSPTVGTHTYEIDVSAISSSRYIRYASYKDVSARGCDVHITSVKLE
jgi:hypothetical protein